MKRSIFIAGLIAALAFPVNNAFSAAITFTLTGHGSGSIAGNPFSDVDFTVTATGDTANRQSLLGFAYFIDNDTASINISGIGDYTFSTATRFFVNNANNYVGFSHAGSLGADLFANQNAAFASWDMLSSIGPVTGTGVTLQWDFSPVVTSGGILLFADDYSATDTRTFQAVLSAVPEPEIYAMLLIGLGFLGFVARRQVYSSSNQIFFDATPHS